MQKLKIVPKRDRKGQMLKFFAKEIIKNWVQWHTSYSAGVPKCAIKAKNTGGLHTSSSTGVQ